jgi:hypothetical protein
LPDPVTGEVSPQHWLSPPALALVPRRMATGILGKAAARMACRAIVLAEAVNRQHTGSAQRVCTHFIAPS